jgi:antitoxin VapB
VRIRRQGSSVVLEPIAEEWKWLDDITERFDEDFIKAVQEQPKPQERPAIEKLFR